MKRRLAIALAPLACMAVAAPAAATPVTFGSGHLEWGVKQSFREYIVDTAEGSYTASDGATKLSGPYGAIDFEVLGGTVDDDTGVGELLIDGTVHFNGHDGALDMTFRNLRLVLAGTVGVLHADVLSKDMQSGEVSDCRDIALGDLGPIPAPTETSGVGWTWDSIDVKLSEAGVEPFGGFYVAGAELDPLDPLAAGFGEPRPRPDRGAEPVQGPCGDGDGEGAGGGGGPGGSPGDGGSGSSVSIVPPKVGVSAKAVSLGVGRVAKIATLRCGTARCAVRTPKSVKVKIARKRYGVDVLAPKSIAPNKTGKLRIRLSKAARRALAGRRTTVQVKVTLVAGGRKTTKIVKATLKARKA